MRAPPVLALLLLAGTAMAAESAPLTRTASAAGGPTTGERATRSAVSVDDAWASARRQAESEARLRHDAAARASLAALASRGLLPASEALAAGGLASLAGADEVAMLLELQRRRHAARDAGGNANLVAGELGALLTTPVTLPTADATPATRDATAHPADEPHPGPRPPGARGLPDRPERLTSAP